MKKVLVLVLVAVGAVVVRNKLKEQEAENRLWAEATAGAEPQGS